jgi:hypothetical protein
MTVPFVGAWGQPLGLTVGPGMMGFDQLVGNAVLGTGAAEDVAGKSDVGLRPILR